MPATPVVVYTIVGGTPAAGLACRPLAPPELLLWSIFRVGNVATGSTEVIRALLDLSGESWLRQHKNTLHKSVTAAV